MQQVTHPHCTAATTTFAARPAPSATVSSTRAPQEPIVVKPEVTLVHVTGAYTDWLTLGLPADICVPPPMKLPGNRSQHSSPLCGDTKSSNDGTYNHIQIEHLGILLQCCFCTWSSGSARMMQDHILKHHRKDDGSCMIPGLKPVPHAARQWFQLAGLVSALAPHFLCTLYGGVALCLGLTSLGMSKWVRDRVC